MLRAYIIIGVVLATALQVDTIAQGKILEENWLVEPTRIAPKPQISLVSCQSHFVAYSLIIDGWKPIAEFSQVEEAVRSAIEEAAGGSTVTHEHWKTAIHKYTGGKYELEEKAHKSAEDAFNHLKSLVSDPDKIPAAGTSINSLLDSNGEWVEYDSGHVITFLNPYPRASTSILNVVNSCEVRNGKQCLVASKYEASDEHIGLKKFGDSYLTYHLVKK